MFVSCSQHHVEFVKLFTQVFSYVAELPREDCLFVSHQTGLNKRSMTRRSIKVGIRGGERWVRAGARTLLVLDPNLGPVLYMRPKGVNDAAHPPEGGPAETRWPYGLKSAIVPFRSLALDQSSGETVAQRRLLLEEGDYLSSIWLSTYGHVIAWRLWWKVLLLFYSYYVLFCTSTQGKGMNPLIPPVMSSIVPPWERYKSSYSPSSYG